jgi:hypothetical protein
MTENETKIHMKMKDSKYFIWTYFNGLYNVSSEEKNVLRPDIGRMSPLCSISINGEDRTLASPAVTAYGHGAH